MGVFPLSINAHSPRSQRAVQVQEQSPSSGSRGSHGVVGLPRFFCDYSAGVRPRFFAILFFFRQDSTRFDRIFIRPNLTNSDKFRPRQKVQTFDTVRHRHLSTNFDIPHAKFRQISTSSVFR